MKRFWLPNSRLPTDVGKSNPEPPGMVHSILSTEAALDILCYLRRRTPGGPFQNLIYWSRFRTKRPICWGVHPFQKQRKL